MADPPTAGGGTQQDGDGGDGDQGAVTSGVLDKIKGGTAVLIALGFLLAFVILVWVMWGKADDANNETAWARWTFLLAGIEAVAFAGAGWLFGKEVHRAEAEAAQEQADQAQQSAQEQTERAAAAEASGRALRNAIETKRDHAGRSGQAERLGGPGGEQSVAELDELATFARQAFP